MNPNQLYFNPGCALSIYKPEKEKQILEYLRRAYPHVAPHNICCRHDPCLPAGSTIINVCAGCDRRFGSLYEGISTVSLWELLDAAEDFPFPDYGGARMSIHDPCPVRERPAVHQAVRNLLRKMNISVVETERHGSASVCCGDSFHGILPPEEVRQKMRERAGSMPCEDVVVYCVSCIKAIHIGGKTPRHLADLLFGESTEIQEHRIDVWHEILERYVDAH